MNPQTGSGTSASRISTKASQFSESVIREMTRQAMLHNAINLAQGFPDFAAPEELKRAAQQAIADDINQYAITWGARDLRQAIAAKAAAVAGAEGRSGDRDHRLLRGHGGDDCGAAGHGERGRRGHRL